MHVVKFHGILMHLIRAVEWERPVRIYLYQDLSGPLVLILCPKQ